jgi:hypothetical protein
MALAPPRWSSRGVRRTGNLAVSSVTSDYVAHLIVLCQVQDFGVTRRPRRKSFFPITTPFHGIRSIGFLGPISGPHKALLIALQRLPPRTRELLAACAP